MGRLCKNPPERDSLKTGWLKTGALILLCFFWTLGLAQKKCRIVFYNTENLFDTRNDPSTADDEFTPRGSKHWTRARYIDKLRKTADVIEKAGEGEWPVFVGLAEVENRAVLDDLSQKTILARANYGIVHQDSPDRRGIDVALLYRKDYFELLTSDFFTLSFPEDTTIRTRDILYASGRLGKDTLHFFVCHFPSMIGGEKQSEWRRIRAASVLRAKADSLFRLNIQAAVVIMGDMNGTANTKAQKVLKTKNPDKQITDGELYNTGFYLLKKEEGSYRYRGRWQTIDHIIVSSSLLNGRCSWQAGRHVSVFSAPFLLEEDKTYFGYKPFPTYRGPRYTGGYSDHLPLYLDLGISSDTGL